MANAGVVLVTHRPGSELQSSASRAVKGARSEFKTARQNLSLQLGQVG